MNIVLPPKRYEEIDHSRFDQIRHKPWFSLLEKRREKIKFLVPALSEMVLGRSQKDAAEKWKVDERELRDFERFWNMKPGPCVARKVFQQILNEAYSAYCGDNAEHHFRYWISLCSDPYGVSSRHVVELWEIDPTFYPENYPQGYRYVKP